MPSRGHEEVVRSRGHPSSGEHDIREDELGPTLRLSAGSANRRLMYSRRRRRHTRPLPPGPRDDCSVHKTQLSILDSRSVNPVCVTGSTTRHAPIPSACARVTSLGQSSGSAASSFFRCVTFGVRCSLAGSVTKILTVRFDSEEAAPHLRTRSEWLATSPASHPIATLASATIAT